MENLGQRLKKARERREIKQEKLVEMVPGSSQAVISALESRNSRSTKLLFEIADALQVNPRWLLTGEGVSGLDGPLLGDPSDPMLHQLIGLYSELSRDSRDQLLGNANRLYAKEHPEKSAANPYGSTRLSIHQESPQYPTEPKEIKSTK